MQDKKLKALAMLEDMVIINVLSFQKNCGYNIIPNLTMTDVFNNVLGKKKAVIIRKALLKNMSVRRKQVPKVYTFNQKNTSYYEDVLAFSMRWVLIFVYDKPNFKKYNLKYLQLKRTPNKKYVKAILAQAKSIADSYISNEDVIEINDEIKHNDLRKLILHYSRENAFKAIHPTLTWMPQNHPGVYTHKFSRICYLELKHFAKLKLLQKEGTNNRNQLR